MLLRDLHRKRVCILGFGREGQAMLRALERAVVDADLTIADVDSATEAHGYKLQTGENYLDGLEIFDIIIKSPGIPPSTKIKGQRSKVTSATQIFLDEAAERGASVIGITGSKGKSTTTTLIYEMLKAGKKDAALVGNIGEPAIGHVDEARPGKIFVMEMSSYQLMDLTRSPRVAVITAFFPEHLDYHGTLAAYLEAKKHITRFQRLDDIVFYNERSPEAKEIAEESPGRKIPFMPADAPLPLSETHLIGEHNLGNMAVAALVAKHVDVPQETILHVLRNFPGLPHRLQHIGVVNGIEWIDDAISTTPESTIAALKALGPRVRTIILGGQDRGNDFADLGRIVAASTIEHVILFPGSGPRIRTALEAAGARVTFHDAPSMDEAVSIAKEVTTDDRRQTTDFTPIVLLSTASPSYGMFKNFEEKGTQFQHWIRQDTTV